ncbi:MAG: RDD family protein [Methanocellales archaeon]|nr:RDD family protein [Methanocellales archaeon]
MVEKTSSAGVRFVSWLVDAVILGVVGSVLGASLGRGATPLVSTTIIELAYFTYFFGTGQTPGMIAMKIKLIGTDGTYPIGYVKGFFRWIGMIISTIVIFLGFLWIVIDENHQGWHDKIAGTYVVPA